MTIPAQRPAPDSEHAARWTLVERAQAGDRDAFGELYAHCADVIFRFVYSHVRSRHLAEDLTHAAFTRGLANITRFAWQGRDIAAWFTTIARNLVLDYYKSGYYRLEVLSGDPSVDCIYEAVDPTVEAERSEAAAILAAALLNLNEAQRRVLRLRFWDDLNIEETATATGMTINAVKASQHRAVRRLALDQSVQALRSPQC